MIKITSRIDEAVWTELKELAEETHQSISGLLTDAVREFLQRRRVRPEVLAHLETSIAENEKTLRISCPGFEAR